MLIPDSSAKVRRLRIPHWLLGALGIPFLCILVLVVLFQTRIINLENLLDHSATRLNQTLDEKGRLMEALDSAGNTVVTPQQVSAPPAAEPERNELDKAEYERQMAELLTRVEAIDGIKQSIINAFLDFAELEIPFRFDKDTLSGGVSQAVGGAYTGSLKETLEELDVVLSEDLRDMIALVGILEELEDYFKARPVGWPVHERQIGSEFGYRLNPFTGRGMEMHEGVDIGVPVGTEVYATAYGEVLYAGWNSGGYGYLVVIKHGHDYSTYYAHNSEVLVTVGEEVARGQLIALSGNSGRSTSPHCHYEVRLDDLPQNPGEYLN